jgi:hypothetical protein
VSKTFLTLFIFISHIICAQDTSIYKKPILVKVGLAHSILLASQPSLGIKYLGVSFEKFRNRKPSFNLMADVFFIKGNTFNTTGFYYPSVSDPLYPKNVWSLRFLYRRYLFQNVKILKGLYLGGGPNLAKTRFRGIAIVIY